MSETIIVFLKIGKPEHIQDLYENGTVYMNDLKFFKETEDDELRGDRNEGAINYSESKQGTFRIEGIDKDFKYEKIRYGEYLDTGNLFSLFCVSSRGLDSPEDFFVDKKNAKFGSQCLIIKKPGVFIERLEKELDKLGRYHKNGFVNYYEQKNHHENLTPFDKPKPFEYQREFRFFVENDKPGPVSVQVGSMKDYAEIIDTEKITTMELKKQ